MASQTIHTTYEYSDDNFANPERGMFKHIDVTASHGASTPLSTFKNYRAQGFSLIYNGYILDAFRDGSDISSRFLKLVETNLQRMREAGLKAILRFYYTADPNDKPWDVPLDITLRHIEQLQPIFANYADVIALVEAGFVGVWGEWYQTEHHYFNPSSWDSYNNRRAIVEALANAVPQSRKIALRTPMYKMGVLKIDASTTLSPDEANSGSLNARLGFHNDCFLANADDAGTYQNIAANRQFTANHSRYTVMGGETCSEANSFTEITNARNAFETYHFTYLNADYHPGALGSWATNGFIDEIQRRLGYRLALLEGEFTSKAMAGTYLDINLSLENIGWASPINPRNVEIVLVDSNDTQTPFTLSVDPREWLPGYQHSINASILLPDQLPADHYAVYLNLPDPCESIANRPEFSIRLANQDCWNPELGMNHLADIEVTAPSAVITPAAPADPSSPIYDLGGRIVGSVSTKASVAPGIYIIGGKKYRL